MDQNKVAMELMSNGMEPEAAKTLAASMAADVQKEIDSAHGVGKKAGLIASMKAMSNKEETINVEDLKGKSIDDLSEMIASKLTSTKGESTDKHGEEGKDGEGSKELTAEDIETQIAEKNLMAKFKEAGVDETQAKVLYGKYSSEEFAKEQGEGFDAVAHTITTMGGKVEGQQQPAGATGSVGNTAGQKEQGIDTVDGVTEAFFKNNPGLEKPE